MSEGEVVEQLVEFTSIVLAGVGLIFSVVSAYVVALNYFIGSANMFARIGSFLFVTLVLGMLVMVMLGAETTHTGLILRLQELDAAGELTAAGKSVLANTATMLVGPMTGQAYSVDKIINLCIWGGLGFVYLALFYLTFLHRWEPDSLPVKQERVRT